MALTKTQPCTDKYCLKQFGMNKFLSWVFAAALICGLNLFSSCVNNNDDNPVKPTDNLAEKIIGKWIFAERNGEPTPTNKKRVFTFISPTEIYVSASRSVESPGDTIWFDHIMADLAIHGNTVTLTMHVDEHTTMVDEFNVTAINDAEFTAILKVTVIVDGTVERSTENNIRLTKVTVDYREAILGMWECKGLKGDETFNDANARLEFFADGTYKYWRKNDAGEWEAVTTREFQDYFVDGTLLATRWKNEGEDELREWWEIKSLKDGKMQWTALRKNDDGFTFQQIMDWERVE